MQAAYSCLLSHDWIEAFQVRLLIVSKALFICLQYLLYYVQLYTQEADICFLRYVSGRRFLYI